MILVIVAVGVAGCAPSYRVHVNTFLEPGASVSEDASIQVASEPNAANPILARQIESKIAVLLEGYGYRPVEAPGKGEYLLTFQTGISSQRSLDYLPMYRPFGGFYGGYYGGYYGGFYRPWGFGYTTYVPYIETVYVHWLQMRLVQRDDRPQEAPRVVWIGEALVGFDEPDIRKAINYLLVGCTDYLFTDTGKWATVTVKKKDPRIQDILHVGVEAPPSQASRQ